MIPYGKHAVNQTDIDAVVKVLEQQFLTQGEQVPAFEQALATYCQSQYAVAVNSGTSALHIACLAIGVGEGDVVWTSPLSFVASANCALYCGAKVDFVDIDAVTRNLCVDNLAQKLATATQLPKALVVVHYAGVSCDMQAISALAKQYGFAVIEDACHGLGGQYQNKPIGSCQYSDMTVLSFHPVKSITTAEGGAVLTNNPELQKQLVLYAKHGITRDESLMQQPSPGDWYYEQIALGFNYRLSDLHAALGISQLNRLDDFIQRRRRLVKNYQQQLQTLPLQLPDMQQVDTSAWHIYTVALKEHDRRQVFNALKAKGIGVNVHYIPIHLQPYYRQLGFKLGDFPIAEGFYHRALTLPLYPDLSDAEQTQVVDVLHEVLS
ncbi:UDP-4-amino-4,6-dideoxy-N-acetyl-beta-L-altrosamine transaminase [Alteromonadaceae bacterium BrNp21-10]|nr:UDP-4-amino-4,6-dideoxy-N-acetyl-beta-L-altrosamine transaminase [Alteromonadaceae bacterium BrNp21-10]